MTMGLLQLMESGWYSLYVLFMMLMAYLLNQLDRYVLAITTKEVAQDIHYGDIVCMINSSYTSKQIGDTQCNATLQTRCLEITNQNGSHVCEWNYNGQGFEYQLLAGPIFIVIFTFSGIFLGFAADKYNRKVLLAICIIFWSTMTILTGLVDEYWQLSLLRMGLGIGEAGCTPFAASILGDYFQEGLRGTALGVYNWGIYVGYSMSYALGNFITKADILQQGWRWTFYLSGMPGILLGFIILLTVKEPQRKSAIKSNLSEEEIQISSGCERLGLILKGFLKPSLLILCLAGSIRNAGGYVWAYNTQLYFEGIGQTPEQIGSYMSWIPLVGGSIGVVLGGFISDRFALKRGPVGRIIVIVASLLLAAPFSVGALFLPAPWCYISLLPANIIGEMWIGITLAIVIELVPLSIRTSAIAMYLFIITNIGGNIPLLVPLLQQAFENTGYSTTESLRASLLILYPGEYVIGAFLYLVSLIVIKREMKKSEPQAYGYTAVPADQGSESEVSDFEGMFSSA